MRLRGTAWNEKVQTHFGERGRIERVEYQPEVQRFGGEVGLFLCENQFNLSSQVALSRLSRPQYMYGDVLFDALRFGVALAAAAKLGRKKIAWYFDQLWRMWLPLYFRNEAGTALGTAEQQQIEAAFEQSFHRQQDALEESLEATWLSLADQEFPADEPEWAFWYKGNKIILDELGETTEKVLPSLLHLHNNRLGLNNQDEVFACYLIAKAL